MTADPQVLYGIPLERFTPERNALAKQLRSEGRREEAARVAKLRKPSLAAWAVNQLVRTQKREIDALFAAGDALREAHEDLLARRGDAGSLRRALETERQAVAELTGRARGLLSADGHELSDAKLEQVSDTLHAAALDDDARAAVRDGCLERELRHVGLGALGAVAPSSPAGPAKRAPRAGEDRDRAARVKAARKAELEARRRAERAAREVHAAEARRDAAAEALQNAERALADAKAAAEHATAEHERTRKRLPPPTSSAPRGPG